MNKLVSRARFCQIYRSLSHHVMKELGEGELAESALVFAPHPDDETLGCGGTIIKKKRAGAKIRIVFTTDGRIYYPQDLISGEELKAIRAKEALAVAHLLGLKESDITFLNFENRKLGQKQEAALDKVTEILVKEQPNQVFIPYYKDLHPDHVSTNKIVLAALQACERKAVVYEYPIWFWYHWPWVSVPWCSQRHILIRLKCHLLAGLRFLRDFHCFTHIGDVMKSKRNALENYKSQMTRLTPDPRWLTLTDVSNGEFLQCFYQKHEIFHRYCFNGKRR